MVVVDPLRPSLRSDTSPKRGGRQGCDANALPLKTYSPSPHPSRCASHLPLKGKALDRAMHPHYAPRERSKKGSQSLLGRSADRQGEIETPLGCLSLHRQRRFLSTWKESGAEPPSLHRSAQKRTGGTGKPLPYVTTESYLFPIHENPRAGFACPGGCFLLPAEAAGGFLSRRYCSRSRTTCRSRRGSCCRSRRYGGSCSGSSCSRCRRSGRPKYSMRWC